jgi:uroporphyrinogen-III synthase
VQKNKIHILCTRPVGEALLKEATQNDIFIDEISFINTKEIVNAENEKKIREFSHQSINVVFTSMNAVEAVSKFISAKTSWNIFCIGNTTKKLVKKIFGEENISGTAASADQLAETILEKATDKNIIFFCGDHRRNELPAKLKKNGFDVEEIIVYKTIQTPEILTKKYDGILFFSPSAVQSFFSKNSLTHNTQVFAIGATTANAIKLFTQQPVIIAENPGKENLLTLVIKHFSKSKIY